ncbi:MAG: YHYH protein [Rhodospirillaceae bacterium]|nr:YHYH protein [Rhodospirillaceae bacterium]
MSGSRKSSAAFFAAAVFLLAGLQTASAHEALKAKAHGVDLTRLPVGDTRVSDKPKVGWIWACRPPLDAPPAVAKGPWFNPDGLTYDLTRKAVVQGEVTWPHRFVMRVEGDRRIFSSNDLPNHPTGEFPISPQDPAYQYDRNPSRISAQNMTVELPLNPTPSAEPTCAPGAVGILLTGVVLFNALDAVGLDAVAHESQDGCQGHPQRDGVYHYHSLTICHDDAVLPDGHSALVGYALDGFGIFGRLGEGGKPLSSADLDECHGHTHAIPWNGKTVTMYHYHGTWDFPYTVGCMRGPFDFADMITISGGPEARGEGLRPRDGLRPGGMRPGSPPGPGAAPPRAALPGTPPGTPLGPRPDRVQFAAAAAKLGVSEQQLMQALGPPPPDFEAAAKRLGVDVETLRRALVPPR